MVKCELLTQKDWVEIYYALDLKLRMVGKGEYRGDRVAKRWEVHLREIMRKIGPDGQKMYSTNKGDR